MILFVCVLYEHPTYQMNFHFHHINVLFIISELYYIIIEAQSVKGLWTFSIFHLRSFIFGQMSFEKFNNIILTNPLVRKWIAEKYLTF